MPISMRRLSACLALAAACTRPAGSPAVDTHMETSKAAVFDEMAAAVTAGDAARYARLYAPDAVIIIHGGGELRGRDAIEKYEVELLSQFPGTRLAFDTHWQSGDSSVVHYGVNSPGPGKPTGHEGLLFYRFDASGLIAEERRYLDGMTPMAQMGMFGATDVRPLPVLPARMTSHAASSARARSDVGAAVRAGLAALGAKDASAFMTMVADDAVFDEMILPRPFVGKSNVKEWFDAWTTAVPDASREITNVLAVGDVALVEMIVRGTLSAPFGRLAASPKPFAVHRAVVVDVRDGKLARMLAFMNGRELAEAVGQWPPARQK